MENAKMIEKSGKDLLEVLNGRVSVRNFTGEKVSDDELKTILNAGFCAPSARNRRPWEFVVMRDKDRFHAFAEHLPFCSMLERGADAAIIICGDQSVTENYTLLINDCSAATENMLLAAHGLGLGGVWCGIIDEDGRLDFFRKELKLPENIVPAAMVVIGRPNDDKQPVDRFTPEHIHLEYYSEEKN